MHNLVGRDVCSGPTQKKIVSQIYFTWWAVTVQLESTYKKEQMRDRFITEAKKMERIKTLEYKCMWCEEKIVQDSRGRRTMYCDEKCKKRYYSTTTPEERQRNHKILGIGNRIYKKKYTCNYCGKEFEGYIKTNRKYCSKACSDGAHSYEGMGMRASLDIEGIPHGSDVRERAMKLYSEGMSANEIAQQLNCNNGTVACWIRLQKKRERGTESCRELSEPYFRYVGANNVVKWREILNDEMERSGFEYTGSIMERTEVRLISPTMKIHKGVDYFSTLITERLELDPFDGGYYAFCGNGREKMRFIRWDGSGFQLTCRRREKGIYVWPPARFGNVVVVSAREFEFILRGSNIRPLPKLTGQLKIDKSAN
jgi:transposase